MLLANPTGNGTLINLELFSRDLLSAEEGNEVLINSVHAAPPYGNTHTLEYGNTYLQEYGCSRNTLRMEFKDRLKAARKHARLSQVELAKQVGIDQTSISDLERGKSKSTSYTAQIAAACGVSAIWLADRKGEMLDYDHSAVLDSIADEMESAVGLRSIPGPELVEQQKNKRTVKLANSLAALASPRSLRALERIIHAADSGRLTEDDVVLLEKIADRIAKGPAVSATQMNAKISGKIKDAFKVTD